MIQKLYPVLSVFVLLAVDILSKGSVSLYDFIKYVAVADAFLLMTPGLFSAGCTVRSSSASVLSEEAVTYGEHGGKLPGKGRIIWACLSVFWIAGVCLKRPFNLIVGITVLLCFVGLGMMCILWMRHSAAVPPAAVQQTAKVAGKPQASSREEREQDLYKRILEVMENDKPWINEHFRLNDMVGMVYSNRQAVSNAVNRRSHMNCCRVVNGYRVEYAKELVRKDPRLTVGDVSMMCGFHNEVSFSMAFQLAENMTPNDWIRKCRHGRV